LQGGRPGVTPSTVKVPVNKPTENSIYYSYRKAHIVFVHVPKTSLMDGVTFSARWMTFIARLDTFDARWTPGSHLQHRENSRYEPTE